MSRIYIASPYWNQFHAAVVEDLRDVGHQVFDYRGNDGAGPEEIFGANYNSLTAADFAAAMADPLAQAKLAADQTTIDECDTFILLLPAGRSSHFEFGYACALGKRTIVAALDGVIPAELIYSLADRVVTSMSELLAALVTADDVGGAIAAIARA